ncbi:hypothetical protein Ait01nite_034700 [Actinoplanes italicus]|uniref:Tetratricopeptide repeat protein n=1 Tax=Actinoplanes italicus TaxID=113567 RepID=A0A2T0K932_9ACTN|nr:DUF6584 family protein [Actinoplanes italicus]PRX19561.1 tetratricopeptide repeat protein [Actinoplanes italicus]GIE30425.1 hypothetical protein Ait01nite_034700 [Actinoplanes italicus]
MAKPDVLSRVDADLERGDTRLAARRLTSLLMADPQDLEIRARLADVYRRAGDVAEAGRWAFLTEDAEPHETAAFATKHRSPADRLRLLRLRGENPRELGPLAESRYSDLVASAATAVTPPATAVVPADAAVTPAAAAMVPADVLPPVQRLTPAPVKPRPEPSWSFMDLFTAAAVFGPGVVVVCVILYEIVTAVLPASPR